MQVAVENARNRGVADRYHTIAGSAFEVDLGSGYDVVLLTNFLHHFAAATCESLLRSIRTALKPAGRVATLEFVPNLDRISPPMPARFAMMMLGATPAGEAYTFAELERMFRAAGFTMTEMRPVYPTPQSVLLSA